MEFKTGSKTINKLTELPVINIAIMNLGDCYSKVKDSNAIIRTSLNLAEKSMKVVAIASSPISYVCQKPFESVDTYLSDKLNNIEKSYPIITKPINEITPRVKEVCYSILKQPIEKLTHIQEKTIKQVCASAKVFDVCLDNRFAKLLTNPVLNSIDYFWPGNKESKQTTQNLSKDSFENKSNENDETTVFSLIPNETPKENNVLHDQNKKEILVESHLVFDQNSENIVQENLKEKQIETSKINLDEKIESKSFIESTLDFPNLENKQTETISSIQKDQTSNKVEHLDDKIITKNPPEITKLSAKRLRRKRIEQEN